MTEQEWLECTDPTPMLTFLEEKVSDRKLRLLGCSCIRHLWTLFEEESPTAIMTSELFADGMTSKAALRRSRRQVQERRRELESDNATLRPRWAALWLSEVAASENMYQSVFSELNRLRYHLRLGTERLNAWIHFIAVVREVVGNPFCPVAISPAWLAWNDGTVRRIAQSIYDERAFDRMPILADALEW